MENLTLEKLPTAVSQLLTKVSNIERILSEKQEPAPTEPTDEILTVIQAAKFLTLSTATVYTLVSQKKIPHMKQGKRVYFSKSDLIEWLKAGRKATRMEMQNNASSHVMKKA